MACGTNLAPGRGHFVIRSRLKIFPPDSEAKCGQVANYACVDGTSAVTLITLTAAIEDDDHVECIISETRRIPGGFTPGSTMPSPTAQSALVRDS